MATLKLNNTSLTHRSQLLERLIEALVEDGHYDLIDLRLDTFDTTVSIDKYKDLVSNF